MLSNELELVTDEEEDEEEDEEDKDALPLAGMFVSSSR